MNTARIAPPWVIAAATSRPSTTADIVVMLGWLILAAAIVIIAGFIVHKKLRNTDDEPADTTAFTLEDLRRLKAAGQLTPAEFERSKAALIAHSRAAMDADATNEKNSARDPDAAAEPMLSIDADSDNQNNPPDGPG